MIFTAEDRKAQVYDQTGLIIPAVTEYNTSTREVTMLVLGKTEGGKTRIVTMPKNKSSKYPRKVIKVKVKIPGSYTIVNGKRF